MQRVLIWSNWPRRFESQSTAKRYYKGSVLAVYRPDDIKQFLVADAPAIEELRGMIAVDAETQTDDKVQALQYRFFLENLDGILNKLK